MEQYEPGGYWWRSSLTPEAYAVWKANMVASQLDEDIPEWKDGNHARDVEHKVFGEWFGDDFNELRATLRDREYADEYLQLFLALPWYAANEYYRVFGASMSQEWRDKFHTFLGMQEPGVTGVIGESTDLLEPGKLRTIASEFNLAVWNFRMSYGEF